MGTENNENEFGIVIGKVHELREAYKLAEAEMGHMNASFRGMCHEFREMRKQHQQVFERVVEANGRAKEAHRLATEAKNEVNTHQNRHWAWLGGFFVVFGALETMGGKMVLMLKKLLGVN